MRRYCKGYRQGGGSAEAVVRPGTLVELWRVANACVAARRIVIVQAANTGLTGGSTPDGDDYDRPVVLVNTMRINGILPLDGGRQVVCLPGATLHNLEEILASLDREPHSLIGSSCIGASVFGGVCNNSGGALIQRGPAYTELALFARLDPGGRLELVNHLGIDLGAEPEEILEKLDRGAFAPQDVQEANAPASDLEYGTHVRQVDARTPARFNADPRRLFEASGSAGRLILFALRLNTFRRPRRTSTFYIGTDDPAVLTRLRREVLTDFTHLPVAAEYLHRDAFDMGVTFGRDMFWLIRWLGVRRLPHLFRIKSRLDGLAERFGISHLSDRLLQLAGGLLPSFAPPRIRAFRAQYAHHLILKVADEGIGEAGTYLRSLFAGSPGDYFECDAAEGEAAFLHRFVTAGAALRFSLVKRDQIEELVSLDVALPRNETDWARPLPAALDGQVTKLVRYGHFFCHVFHDDYLIAKGEDPEGFKSALLELFDARGAECPAEHNVGHLYQAKPALKAFYRELDPCNAFNPGIGRTSKNAGWRS